MTTEPSFLCADCGRVVLTETAAQQESLCEACEERLMDGRCSWPGYKKTKEEE